MYFSFRVYNQTERLRDESDCNLTVTEYCLSVMRQSFLTEICKPNLYLLKQWETDNPQEAEARLQAPGLPALLLCIAKPHLRAWNLVGEEKGRARTPPLTDRRATVAMRGRGARRGAALPLLGGVACGTALPQPRAVPHCSEERCIAAQLQWKICRVVV